MSARWLVLVLVAAFVCSGFAQEATVQPEPIAKRIDARIKEALDDHEFSDDDAVAVTVYVLELFLGPRQEGKPFLSYVRSAEHDTVEAHALYDGLKVSGYAVKFYRSADRKAAFVQTITRLSGDG